jgi:hypothetical protein
MYCTNCGSEIKDPSQKFCEKCGSSIPTSAKQDKNATIPKTTNSTTTLGFEPYDRPGGLFDTSRNYYILKERVKVIHF